MLKKPLSFVARQTPVTSFSYIPPLSQSLIRTSSCQCRSSSSNLRFSTFQNPPNNNSLRGTSQSQSQRTGTPQQHLQETADPVSYSRCFQKSFFSSSSSPRNNEIPPSTPTSSSSTPDLSPSTPTPEINDAQSNAGESSLPSSEPISSPPASSQPTVSTDSNTPNIDEDRPIQSTVNIRASSPLNLLRRVKKHEGVGNLDFEVAKEMCFYFGDVAEEIFGTNHKASENEVEAQKMLEDFLIEVSEKFGYQGVSRWGMKTLSAGYGDRVIQVWDRITISKLIKEGRPLPRRMLAQQQQQQQQQHAVANPSSQPPLLRIRRTLEMDVHASLFFTCVIWSYASSQYHSKGNFKDALSKLLYQTWVPPLSSVRFPQFPSHNPVSIRFGLSKIEKGLEFTIKDKKIRELAKKMTCQADFAQIDWPNLHLWNSKMLKIMNDSVQDKNNIKPFEEWKLIWETWRDGNWLQSGVRWGSGRSLAGDQLIKQQQNPTSNNDKRGGLPSQLTGYGILPRSIIPTSVIGAVFSALVSQPGMTIDDSFLKDFLRFADSARICNSYTFWFHGLDRAAKVGNLELLQNLLTMMKHHGFKEDDYSKGQAAVACFNAGLKEAGLKELNAILSKDQISFSPLADSGQSDRYKDWNEHWNVGFQYQVTEVLTENRLWGENFDVLATLVQRFRLNPCYSAYNKLLDKLLARTNGPLGEIEGSSSVALLDGYDPEQLRSNVHRMLQQLSNHRDLPKFNSRRKMIHVFAQKLLGIQDFEIGLEYLTRSGLQPDNRFWMAVVGTETAKGYPEKMEKIETFLERFSAATNNQWKFRDLGPSCWTWIITGFFKASDAVGVPQETKDRWVQKAIDFKREISAPSSPHSNDAIKFNPIDYEMIIFSIFHSATAQPSYNEIGNELVEEFWRNHSDWFNGKVALRNKMGPRDLVKWLIAFYRRVEKPELKNQWHERLRALP